MKKEKVPIPYQKRKALYGYGFISIWLIGTILWFLYPLAESLRYSFMKVSPEAGGMQGTWIGWENYSYVLTTDANYTKYLVSVLTETLWKTPLILIFSLFIAVILNQNFKGRTFARAVFFLPVIIATGPVYSIISGNISNSGTNTAGQFSTLFSSDLMGELFKFLGLYNINPKLPVIAQTVADNIFGVVWNSGIQILIFLAALQNIPSSAKEAAQIEGATGWEYFWKVTLPYVSPMVLACFIFTVIDSFTSPDNAVMERLLETQSEWQYGYASAMAWIYFFIVMTVIGIVTIMLNHFIYYETD